MDWDKLRIFHAVASAGSFTHALRAETGSLDSVGGTGLLAYSITNLVAVLLLVIPLRSGAGAGLQAAIVVLIGAVMALMVIPIIGIVIFSLMIGHGMRLRKIRAGTHTVKCSYAVVPKLGNRPDKPVAAPRKGFNGP